MTTSTANVERNEEDNVEQEVPLQASPQAPIAPIVENVTHVDLRSTIQLLAQALKVKLSMTFHPQTDGKVERTIQTLKDMLMAYVIDLKGNWDDHLPLIEFSYNNSYHSSIGMATFEALYGRRCRSPLGWFEVGEITLICPDLVYEAIEKVRLNRERLRTAQSRQMSYADVRRKDLEFEVNDWSI
ncbi:hypothetical protein MTR67_034413 [Solanum verrucosum]|uniref:Integrase catalytic domain-containing protein n=1 Tax=Solanum verrucosum TaxID=315347 RepID=A0AAF0ZKD0_SOLVR|nr:hypothetical protein MTR67_034413 [Solanum verrucosum]